MAEIRRTRQVTIGEKSVTVRELTVAEIRAWLRDIERIDESVPPPVDAVGELLFEDISFSELQRMSDIDEAVIAAATPSALSEVIEVARELNPHFFGMRARLDSMGRAVLSKSAPGTSS